MEQIVESLLCLENGRGYFFGCLTFWLLICNAQIDAALEQGVDAVRMLVLNGFDKNVNRFNLGQKYKYHKV